MSSWVTSPSCDMSRRISPSPGKKARRLPSESEIAFRIKAAMSASKRASRPRGRSSQRVSTGKLRPSLVTSGAGGDASGFKHDDAPAGQSRFAHGQWQLIFTHALDPAMTMRTFQFRTGGAFEILEASKDVEGAYHGDTTGAMSVGYSPLFHKPFERMVFECQWAPAPDVSHSPLRSRVCCAVSRCYSAFAVIAGQRRDDPQPVSLRTKCSDIPTACADSKHFATPLREA